MSERDALTVLPPTELAAERHARAERVRQKMHSLLNGELDGWLFAGTTLDPQYRAESSPLKVIRSRNQAGTHFKKDR